MANTISLRAMLIKEIPTNRFYIEKPSGRKPVVGDIVELDQSYTGTDGRPMATVYCPYENGADLYRAEVYESEIELLKIGK